MANYIKVAVRNSILTLFERGWTKSKIARELGINRETVARYIRLENVSSSKPAIPTAGNGPPSCSKPAISTAGDAPPSCSKPAISTAPMGYRGRKSLCEPYRRQVERKLEGSRHSCRCRPCSSPVSRKENVESIVTAKSRWTKPIVRFPRSISAERFG